MDPEIVPEIKSKTVDNDELSFTLVNVDTRVANSLRRTILADIECVVFRTFPDEANQCTILANTSLFHNEIVKQRLSCIPIVRNKHVDLNTVELHLKVKNESNVVQVVTTNDFKVQTIGDCMYVSDAEVKKMFPPKTIDGREYYITFLRLRPKISDTILGEEINLTCRFQTGTAKESGMFNVVSKCSYVFTPDVAESDRVWKAKEKELKGTPEENKTAEINWKLLDAKRCFVPNSFDFIIKGIGIYTPTMIVKMACKTIMKQLTEIKENDAGAVYTITNNDTMMPYSHDYILVHGDYTIGKILEYQFHKDMFPESVQYVSFFKKHPHDVQGVLRVAFTSETDILSMQRYMETACDSLIEIYTKIKDSESFKKM
jgi:DNA-directed RNA polymerase subunit L